jgi:hypothetical protein
MFKKVAQLLKEASEEIERLREENNRLKTLTSNTNIEKMASNTEINNVFGVAVENNEFDTEPKTPKDTFEKYFG